MVETSPAVARLLQLQSDLDALRQDYSRQIVEGSRLRAEVTATRKTLIEQATARAAEKAPVYHAPQSVDLQGNVTGGAVRAPIDPELSTLIQSAHPPALIEAGCSPIEVARFTAKTAQLDRAIARIAEAGKTTRKAADYYDRAVRAASRLGIRV